MNVKSLISFIALFIILAINVVSGPGCANIVPPGGGFRDSLPPLLTKASPRDSTKNFEGNKINLSFDEFVQVDNFEQNVLVSPVPRRTPSATYKLNTISIRLRDSLEANTTYTINFGDAIKDVNEGNVMKNFSYVFATGPTIDSLSFSGNVILAESGKVDSTLIVILHTKREDSVVIKERPRYMTKLDGKGYFIFRNLPAGTFYVYALKDEARALRYQNNKQLFAFADSAVVVKENTPGKTLYAYEGVKAEQTTPGTGSQNAADKRLKYQTTISNNRHDLLKKFSFLFDRPLRRFDSSKLRIATDTLYTPVTEYTWSTDSTKKKLTLNYSWQENTLYHLILEKDFATDTLGHQLLKADTISFTTMENKEYGKLSLRFRNLDLSKNPVLQFVQSDEVVSSFPLTSVAFSQALFLPGEYELRILNDINQNGVWDPGEFFGKHRQPETVKPVQRRITVKENWDNEIEIVL
ncbi:MAG: Ig-like domain-containing protein [Bacteroidota bacterium]